MPQLNTIVPATELEAVNLILRTVGEDRLSDLDAAISGGDVQAQRAVDTLRLVMLDIQHRGWKFNYRAEERIANSTVGGEEGFTVPSNLLAFRVSPRADQLGSIPTKQTDGTYAAYPNHLDLAVGGDVSGTSRFIDRLTNSTVIAAADRAQIFLDIIYSVDFADMPSVMRNYVAWTAAHQFAASEDNEKAMRYALGMAQLAERAAIRDQRPIERQSMLDDANSRHFFGRRRNASSIQRWAP